MTIALIVAVANAHERKKKVIGNDGDLPWHFSTDLKYFKEKTLHQTVVMGHSTYKSIIERLGKPLPERKNIVLSRDLNFRDDRITVIHDPTDIKKITKKDEITFIIGGASIYEQTIDMADLLYVTYIEKKYRGDAFFPSYEKKKWRVKDKIKTKENGVTLRFYIYERIGR